MMKIDFYILKDQSQEQVWQFACRLIEKAHQLGHKIFVWCSDEQQAKAFDDVLWAFEPTSFIPHHLQGEGPLPPPKVQIAWGDHAQGFNDILINLHSEIPSFYRQFKRICEIVGNDETTKIKKRLNYRYYQEQQLGIETHTIT